MKIYFVFLVEPTSVIAQHGGPCGGFASISRERGEVDGKKKRCVNDYEKDSATVGVCTHSDVVDWLIAPHTHCNDELLRPLHEEGQQNKAKSCFFLNVFKEEEF